VDGRETPRSQSVLLDTHRAWMDEGTRRFDAEVGRLPDHELRAPSALPGWTRAHVVAHVARNADALGNLLTWARTGIESPMYASREQRAADIEEGAGQSAEILRFDLDDAERRLALAIESLPEAAWSAEIRTRSGRAVPASEVVWMRCKEVWIHAVDLGAGVSFADFPDSMLQDLLAEVTAQLTSRPETHGIELVATDADGAWAIGPRGPDEVVVQGPTPDLLEWLVGRGAGVNLTSSGTGLPELPNWL
jgi:maleylpyruvate isomerase